MERRTKIVSTIGPASNDPAVIEAMIEAGMNVARINLSHGAPSAHLETIAMIRGVAAKMDTEVGILIDLPGPKIRTTSMGDDGVQFVNGSTVEIISSSEPTTAERICTDYPTCAQDLQVGDGIVLGDGGVDLQIVAVEGGKVKAKVMNGGLMKGRPGLHLPSDRVSLPVPTPDDFKLIDEVVIPANPDFCAVSFVKTAGEMRQVKEKVAHLGTHVVAKIETPAALENLDSIVMESDAVMVARGDLGTECPLEMVPVFQKRIIQTCLAYAVPVITATQMLESMITAATPTRAEVSDVANAVCDGTDAIMLSGESAVGHNPALAIATMARIAQQAEKIADYEHIAQLVGEKRNVSGITAAITHGAWRATRDIEVSAIICCTNSGATATAMAALRPGPRLIAISTTPKTVTQQQLTWGMQAMQLPEYNDRHEMITAALEAAQKAGYVEPGDVVAVISGSRNTPGSTNNLHITTAV